MNWPKGSRIEYVALQEEIWASTDEVIEDISGFRRIRNDRTEST